jgi:anti-sigma factor RsiW
MLGDLCGYIDGELEPELCAQLEKHLADCPNCRVVLDSLNKTVRIFREGVEEPVPDELKRNLQAALERKWAKKNQK